MLFEVLTANDPVSTSQHNLITDLTVGQIVAALATLGVLVGIIVKMHRPLKQLGQMLTDWHGTPARPGVKAKPGVMARLDQHEERLDAVFGLVSPVLEGPTDHEEVLARLDSLKAGQRRASTRIDEISHSVHRNQTAIAHVDSLVRHHISEHNLAEERHEGPRFSTGPPAEPPPPPPRLPPPSRGRVDHEEEGST